MKRGTPFDEQISEEMMDRAWNLHCKGFSNKDIAERLGFHLATFDKHKRKFYTYFAQRRRAAEKKSSGRPRGSDRLDKLRRAAIELASLGENMRTIARQLDIAWSTFKSWMEADPGFGYAIRTAKDMADENVIRSLLRRATGCTIRHTSRTRTLDRNGQPISTYEHSSTRRLPPHVNAIKLWLVNNRGWLSESEGSRVNEDESKVEYDVREGLYNGE